MAEVTPDSGETCSLLEAAQAGDQSAFERLFAKHRRYLRHVLDMRLDARFRARVDASDLVQETQLEAFRRLADFCTRRPMPFRLWLRKTAQERLYVAYREHMQAARRSVTREVPLPEQSSLLLAQAFVPSVSTPSQPLRRVELARKVREALALLSESDREILLLRALEGLSNQEVAQVLDLDPATSSKRHGRALVRLHEVLVRSGLAETDV
jgi:RNA polymerase sigma-70 factor (ECF subfamily)